MHSIFYINFLNASPRRTLSPLPCHNAIEPLSPLHPSIRYLYLRPTQQLLSRHGICSALKQQEQMPPQRG